MAKSEYHSDSDVTLVALAIPKKGLKPEDVKTTADVYEVRCYNVRNSGLSYAVRKAQEFLNNPAFTYSKAFSRRWWEDDDMQNEVEFVQKGFMNKQQRKDDDRENMLKRSRERLKKTAPTKPKVTLRDEPDAVKPWAHIDVDFDDAFDKMVEGMDADLLEIVKERCQFFLWKDWSGLHDPLKVTTVEDQLVPRLRLKEDAL